MSHSGELALYAFSTAGAVGVDLETARRPIDEVAIAARLFREADAQRLQSLAPRARRREFLRLWTRYEAELKCRGLGIGGEPAKNTPAPVTRGARAGYPDGRRGGDRASSARVALLGVAVRGAARRDKAGGRQRGLLGISSEGTTSGLGLDRD